MASLLLFLFLFCFFSFVHSQSHASYEEQLAPTREEQTKLCLRGDILLLLESTIATMADPSMPLRAGQTRQPNHLALFGKKFANQISLGYPVCKAYARVAYTLSRFWSYRYLPVPESESIAHCQRTLALSSDPYVRYLGLPGTRFTPPNDRLRQCLEAGMFASLLPSAE
jgi:hypothetical protein